MRTPSNSILAYIQAKDGNRPHLISRAFTEDATLSMVVNTGSIAFPPESQGRDTIADLLVRRFGQAYENIYTFCLSVPPKNQEPEFICDWLVVMSEKESRAVRVGCGRYHWFFSQESHLVERLTITIEAMQSLPPQDLDSVMVWASSLPYPWCSAQTALDGAPDLADLSAVLAYLGRENI
ncbi:hypothetical protein LT85_2414 [Collimonas arenae]|uniref:SnoaL-like domain-containing protein n=1 Tax=Collimonas arenae TaxID=279058 RepID=A0A0A1FFE3_9BURK|nr:hypothetical protein [Collimonas arenae]AIY41572.1 hypothetical protein LT85_2414 [Collimonas arenae]